MAALALPYPARVAVAHVVGCEPSEVARRADGRLTARGMPVSSDHRQQATFWQALIEYWGFGDETLHDLLKRGPAGAEFECFERGASQGRLNKLIQSVHDVENS